jgi:predicted Rdx family selenoprotein
VVELDRGSGGIFDVIVDGDLIFSKFDVGRFPEDGEVIGALGEVMRGGR